MRKGKMSKQRWGVQCGSWIRLTGTWTTVVLAATKDADAGVRLEAVRAIGDQSSGVKSATSAAC